jgi:hypothetical protein
MPVRRWLPVLALALVATTPGHARPGGAVVIAWNDPATGRGALAAMRGTPPWDLLTPVLEVGRDATVRASGRLVYATSPVDGTMVYSLSHVALPFPLSDGLYGLKPDPAERFGIHLGTLTHGASSAFSSSIRTRRSASCPIRSSPICSSGLRTSRPARGDDRRGGHVGPRAALRRRGAFIASPD